MNMSKFQIATKPGHRASEHVFCVMSIMLLNEKQGRTKILALYDVMKFFDKEAATDVQYEIYKKGIQGKLYRLVYKLNENLKIKVRTPVGLTDSANLGPSVGQGTNSGAILSAVSLDGGVSISHWRI